MCDGEIGCFYSSANKLKKLYRKVAPNKAYHSGERAKGLVSHLDMAEIRTSAPVPLEEIDKAVVSG